MHKLILLAITLLTIMVAFNAIFSMEDARLDRELAAQTPEKAIKVAKGE